MMSKLSGAGRFLGISGRAGTAPCMILTLMLTLMMTGCGQKGPLYIPDTPATQKAQDEDS
jgi:hypothetical protein